MVRNVGGKPRPFGNDKKKKISINDASSDFSRTFKLQDWRKIYNTKPDCPNCKAGWLLGTPPRCTNCNFGWKKKTR